MHGNIPAHIWLMHFKGFMNREYRRKNHPLVTFSLINILEEMSWGRPQSVIPISVLQTSIFVRYRGKGKKVTLKINSNLVSYLHDS